MATGRYTHYKFSSAAEKRTRKIAEAILQCPRYRARL